jgi:hypothetical protein
MHPCTSMHTPVHNVQIDDVCTLPLCTHRRVRGLGLSSTPAREVNALGHINTHLARTRACTHAYSRARARTHTQKHTQKHTHTGQCKQTRSEWHGAQQGARLSLSPRQGEGRAELKHTHTHTVSLDNRLAQQGVHLSPSLYHPFPPTLTHSYIYYLFLSIYMPTLISNVLISSSDAANCESRGRGGGGRFSSNQPWRAGLYIYIYINKYIYIYI